MYTEYSGSIRYTGRIYSRIELRCTLCTVDLLDMMDQRLSVDLLDIQVEYLYITIELRCTLCTVDLLDIQVEYRVFIKFNQSQI